MPDTVIASDVECRTCVVVLDSVAELKGVTFNGPATVIARLHDGSYVLRDGADGLLKRFGQDGRLVHHLGRAGGGPGEYEQVRNIVAGPADTIQIFDGALGRHTWYGSTGAFLRSQPIALTPAPHFPAVLMSDGRIAINTVVTDSQGPRSLVAIVGADGQLIRLSPSVLATDDGNPRHAQRLLAGRVNGGLIVADPWTFRVELFDAGLRNDGLVVRTADWIPTQPPDGEQSDGVFDRPFTPQLRGVWEDSAGRLWLQMSVPSDEWEPGPSQAGAGAVTSEEYMKLASRPRVTTVIEVIDIEQRKLLARAKFERPVGLPFGGGFLVMAGQGTEGDPMVQILLARMSE